MTKYCHDPECAAVEFDDLEFMCLEHHFDLVFEPPPRRRPEPPPPDPDKDDPEPEGSGRSWSTDTCWSCDSPAKPDNTECLNCLEPLTPPRLLLTWDSGTVRVDPGDSVQLGREGPHKQLFDGHLNVSRRHATVGVDPDGTPWIRPLESTNGVFHPADGPELDAGSRRDLHDGETLRFALDMRATIAVYAPPGT